MLSPIEPVDLNSIDLMGMLAKPSTCDEYRELLIALAEGREVPDTDLPRILGDRTPEQFERDLRRVRQRLAAAKKAAEADEFEATTLAKARQSASKAATEVEAYKKRIAQEYEIMLKMQTDAYHHMKHCTSHCSDLKRHARSELEATYGANLRDELEDILNQISGLEQEAERLHDKEVAANASIARQQVDGLRKRVDLQQKRLNAIPPGSAGRASASAELILAKNALLRAESHIEAHAAITAKQQLIYDEMAKLQDRLKEMATAHLDWRNFYVS